MSQEVLHRPLNVAVLTVSDTRTIETDKGGNKVQELLEAANHNVVARKIVIDDYDEIRNAIIPWCNNASIDVVISTGGNSNTLIFSIPGSVGAVTLGMSKLIIPEMPHLVREINK